MCFEIILRYQWFTFLSSWFWGQHSCCWLLEQSSANIFQVWSISKFGWEGSADAQFKYPWGMSCLCNQKLTIFFFKRSGTEQRRKYNCCRYLQSPNTDILTCLFLAQTDQKKEKVSSSNYQIKLWKPFLIFLVLHKYILHECSIFFIKNINQSASHCCATFCPNHSSSQFRAFIQ